MYSEKDYFKQACFTDDLQKFYRSYINEKRDRIQFFIESIKGDLIHRYWKPSNICCYTGIELKDSDLGIHIGYWTPFQWKPIHKDLVIIASKEESFECQSIDCNCNDCIHLVRKDLMCDRFNKKVNPQPNICDIYNQKCFVHRRSVISP
jgi:hypothetical protein